MANPDNAVAEKDGTVGLMLDVGLPDGVNGSAVYRPISRVRLHGGLGYNGISPGVRAGVSVAAIPFWVTPTATIEAGHYFKGDANKLARMISGDDSFNEPTLKEFGYTYANAHIGVEFGFSGMTYYLHGGMSMVQMRVRNLNESLASVFDDPDGPKLEVNSDPRVRMYAPSARTGFIYYF